MYSTLNFLNEFFIGVIENSPWPPRGLNVYAERLNNKKSQWCE